MGKEIVTNVEEAEDPMIMCTNVGDRKMKLTAENLGMDHKIWVNEELMTIVVAFKCLRD